MKSGDKKVVEALKLRQKRLDREALDKALREMDEILLLQDLERKKEARA